LKASLPVILSFQERNRVARSFRTQDRALELEMSEVNTAAPEFSKVTLATLDALTFEEFDALPFGVIGLTADGKTEVFNATESRLAGLPAETVIGKVFFLAIAQCMNNFMVAQRLADEPELDASLDYVLTFRMRPTPVRLRLLRSASASRRYVLVQR